MIDAFVRGILGPWGSQLLDFYLQYSLWINGAILLYFLLLIVGRRNYRNIFYFIIDDLKQRYSSKLKNKTAAQIEKELSRLDIPWEAAFQSSRMPIISSPAGLVPYPLSQGRLQKIITPARLSAALAEQNDQNR
jgi:hypothetical protein